MLIFMLHPFRIFRPVDQVYDAFRALISPGGSAGASENGLPAALLLQDLPRPACAAAHGHPSAGSNRILSQKWSQVRFFNGEKSRTHRWSSQNGSFTSCMACVFFSLAAARCTRFCSRSSSTAALRATQPRRKTTTQATVPPAHRPCARVVIQIRSADLAVRN